MKTVQHTSRPLIGRTGSAGSIRLAATLSTALLLCTTAAAQYGTGSTGTAGMPGTPAYANGSPSYGGNGKAIGIGLGAAAGGAALLYVALHHRGSVGGCVTEANDRLSLTDEKTGKTYSLRSAGEDLKAGDRVQLSGKVSKDDQGAATFEVKKVVKDMGACR